jgi:hypothetical protein
LHYMYSAIMKCGYHVITLSFLPVNKSEEGDSGEYICWAENRAGKAETNFTLRIGYFAGSGQLGTRCTHVHFSQFTVQLLR